MRTTIKTLAGQLALLLTLAIPAAAAAQSLVSTGESFLSARLASGAAAPQGGQMVGVVLDLSPGWKTYWRNPGGSGIPPKFDWSKSRNLASAEIAWPRPEFFESFGLTTIGYKEQVVFPVRVTPKDPSQPVELAVEMEVGVCHDICVLEETAASLTVAPGETGPDAALIAAAEARVPRAGKEMGLATATCTLEGAGAERRLEATLDFGRDLAGALAGAKVILEGPDASWFRDVRTVQRDGKLHVEAAMSLLDAGAWVSRSDLRMTVLGDNIAADVKGCTAPAG